MIIPLNLGEKSYDIVLDYNLLAKIGTILNLNRKVLVVTDSGIPKSYSETVASQCKEGYVYTIEQGESSKNIHTFESILKAMLDYSFTRKDCVVAVGGGVVGDLSGFAASCYMRGIDFYNVPTTLLSQVDSSVGGKTAIDFYGVKNIIGSFYQPKKVVIDMDTLKTLSRRQLLSGLMEAFKMGATFDTNLFETIENSPDLEKDLPYIIQRSLEIKRDVVQQDEKEGGVRAVLNFGHTLGHGIESFNNGAFLHGECVAMGMIPMCEPSISKRIIKTMEKYGLPIKCNCSKEDLLPYVLHDKKSNNGNIKMVYVSKLGTFDLINASKDDVIGYMEGLL
ncbi:MAG: 3-dehydroquinate synthase [Sphaerochaetaceae bacterium]|nr:3-dehydroquinate synthase [Sphaerochaetaceae bacterium]